MSPSLSALSLAAITEAVDSDAPVPGGGAVAACTGALASALAGMTARFSARSAAQPGQFSARLRSDAAAAALLAAAVAGSAAIFVAENVRGGPGDPRISQAHAAAAEAAAIAQHCAALASETPERRTG